MKNVKILICDDQEVDHTLVKQNFIENTFFKGKADVDSIYYFKRAPNGKGSPFLDLLPEKFDYDIVFLDLNFLPEGIEEDDEKDGVIDEALDKLKTIGKDALLLILSKDGGNRSDSLTKQGVPIIDKNANQQVISKFLRIYYDRFVRSKIAGCTFENIQIIKEEILNDSPSISISGESYYTSSLFAHIDSLGYYSICQDIPNFEQNKNFKFILPLREYFKELIGNPKWNKEEKKWEERLSNFIKAHLIMSYCKDTALYDKCDQVVENTLLVWDMSVVNDFKVDDKHMSVFMKKLNTRRLIVFLYLVCNYDHEYIYYLLKGTKNNLGEKTVSNGFLYSYFLFDISTKSEEEDRKKTYPKVRNQLIPYDKKLLKKIGNEFIDELKTLTDCKPSLDISSFKKELNNLD